MDGATRSEIAATYAHPYRRWLPLGLRTSRLPVTVLVASVLVLAAGVAELAGDGSPGLTVLAGFAVVVAVVWALVVTVASAQVIRSLTREWRAAGTPELERVRRARPHAAEAHPDLAHDEYAVTVETGDRLATWRYRTLEALERLGDGERLIPGTPRRAVSVAGEVGYTAADVAAASEALVAAQSAAAAEERAAIARAERARTDGEHARDRATESASTREALRRLTGQ